MRSSFSLLTLLLFATTTCTTFLLLLNFAPIGFSNAASIRDENADDENENKGQRKRGINVEEDPNVYQYTKGTEEHVEVLTRENFKKFTTSGEHVLVTFYAPWDGHSKSFLKQFHELGTSHTISSDSRLKFGKVDATVEKELAKEFEVVVIDSAPLLAVPDTRLIIPKVDNFCLVIRAEQTPKNAVRKAIDLLADDGVEPAGIVINGYEEQQGILGSKYRYGYGGYGQYGQGDGSYGAYGSDDDDS